jgi:hypothetical protein
MRRVYRGDSHVHRVARTGCQARHPRSGCEARTGAQVCRRYPRRPHNRQPSTDGRRRSRGGAFHEMVRRVGSGTRKRRRGVDSTLVRPVDDATACVNIHREMLPERLQEPLTKLGPARPSPIAGEDGQTHRAGRALGPHREHHSAGSAQAARGSTARVGSGCPRWHSLRSEDRNRMGTLAARNGVRKRHDLLAETA